ncbi:MAG: MopE-related protein, partial [Chitinophagales bacterium]
GAAFGFCEAPGAPYVLITGDCNDADASINPGATEICNGLDDDCVGGFDDGLTFLDYYADVDGDGYGQGAAFGFCEVPGAPYVLITGDCDDADATVYPGVIDLCNGIDNDCDGNIDDDALFTTYYLDNDGDNYGDQLFAGTTFCYVPAAPYVLDNTDCNDADASINPGASEICNAIDEDCDGIADDGLTFTTYYKDNDGDGYGDGTYGTATTCDGAPATYVADNTDCEDFNDAINPAAIEVCNFIDDNCSGISDEGLPILTFYQDADGDNFGNPLATLEACGPYGAMWITNNEDCDDTNDAVYPGATEICDGLDNNCDGNVDDGIVTATISPSGVVVTCKGVPQTFTANTGIGYTYQWFKNGNIIVGATSSTYSSNKPANYQVQVNTPEGCFALSEPTGLGVSPNPNANVSAPNGLNMCLATVKLKASFGATYTYQWYLDGTPISGATNFTYFPVTTGNYYCEITNEFDCSRTTATVTVINVCREGLSTEPIAANTTLAVYPNPADNLFNVEMELDELNTDATVTVFNILGEVVYNAQVALFNGTLNTTVDASSFTSGAYIVSVSVNGKMYTTNLMITE